MLRIFGFTVCLGVCVCVFCCASTHGARCILICSWPSIPKAQYFIRPLHAAWNSRAFSQWQRVNLLMNHHAQNSISQQTLHAVLKFRSILWVQKAVCWRVPSSDSGCPLHIANKSNKSAEVVYFKEGCVCAIYIAFNDAPNRCNNMIYNPHWKWSRSTMWSHSPSTSAAEVVQVTPVDPGPFGSAACLQIKRFDLRSYMSWWCTDYFKSEI